MAVLHCTGLNFTYNNAKEPTLTDVSFSVEAGALEIHMGSSGCGKTTLLKLLKPEISPLGKLTGSIEISGSDRGQMQPRAGFVPQDPESGFVSDTVRGELYFGAEKVSSSL